MSADTTNNNDLPHLKTSELIKLYHQRHNDADAVWGMIMMRAILYEQTEEENKSLTQLLRECDQHIEPGSLKERVHEAITKDE